jgi:hypothetical protein
LTFISECLPHLPYPPDLTFSDCHIFEPLKEALDGKTLGSDEEIQAAVYEWQCMWPKENFSQEFQALMKNWRS